MLKKAILLIFTLIFATSIGVVFAQDKSDLEKKIAEYENKIDELKQQKTSLASQIQYMDTQIYLAALKIQETQRKIETTQKEINVLGARIEGLDTSMDYLSKLLLTRIVNDYKQHTASVFDLILNSDNADTLINKYQYYKTAQRNNQKILVQVQEAKQNFEEQKTLREDKKTELDRLTKTLDEQKDNLDGQKQQKQKLLDDTGNSEARYQELLAEAKRQLAGFTKFVSNQGGDSLLSNQTVCDDWGCYYNQRDSQWGGNSLNNTEYTLSSAGCLITSMAMVYTHYGHRNVTPQTINSNPDNFASYYGAYLKFTIVADGATSTRINSEIDSQLSGGNPVVVGISYDSGPIADHFVVLISGSNGSYMMNDPYYPNAHNVPFDSHYSVGQIRNIQKVVFN